jgi:hypothetical protein
LREAGAVVHRGPHDGQAQGDVDGPAEGHQLDRYEALIVVAGDHRVELAVGGAAEHRVARNRVADVDAARAAALDHRREHFLLLVAQQAALAGVRIQAGQRQPRPRHPEAGQLGVREGDGRLQPLAGQQRGHVGQRHVHGGEHHRQAPRVEHHPDLAGAGQLGQQLGVPAPAQPGPRPRLLVDRTRGHRVDAPRHCVPDGARDRLVGRTPGHRRHHARTAGAAARRFVEDRLADLQHRRIARGAPGHLRTDAGRISGRDADAGEWHGFGPAGAHAEPQPPQPPEPQSPHEPEPHEPVRLHDPSWAQPANCSPAAFGSS